MHMYWSEEDCESVAALRGIVYALPVNVTRMGMHECYVQILNLRMGVCAGMVT